MNIWDVMWKCELTFELLVFSFLMCRHFGKKSFFWLRAAAGSGICLFGSVLLVSNTTTMWESIPGIIMIFLLSMLTMVFCYENPVREILFVSIAAYILVIVLYIIFILLQTFLKSAGNFIYSAVCIVAGDCHCHSAAFEIPFLPRNNSWRICSTRNSSNMSFPGKIWN